MKQIFDGLREKFKEDIEWYETHGINKDFNRGIIGEANKGISLVDEAEAKWEADCCEWELFIVDDVRTYANCKYSRDVIDLKEMVDFKFCPYCGRKISEVE